VATLLENLSAFNRKERFFVVGWALGNPAFKLGDHFRQQMSDDVGIAVPADAFCAMDFHLDWIIGCLWLTKGVKGSYDVLETGEVNRSNDDIDLLIGFEEGNSTVLLLIEAKGVTGWHNKQLRAKAKRLGSIFGVDEVGGLWPGVRPVFVMTSPTKMAQIDVSEWPGWMRNGDAPRHWLELVLPSGLKKIVRCDEDGKKRAEGGFWKVV
jgi:hypothetical protein